VLNEDYVVDSELLYRCVFYTTSDGTKTYKVEGDKAYISSQAFRDSGQAPSVDRANLCDHRPVYTQRNPKNGVVSLICSEVRLIDCIIQNNPRGCREFIYKIDVLARPLPDNLAHAQIEPAPSYRSKNIFRKLQERLAFLANQRGWEIEPWELRSGNGVE
jgi:hypothetical protein